MTRSYYTVIEDLDYIRGCNVKTMTVMAQDPPRQKFSSLYDANGNKLYSVESSGNLGFIEFSNQSE